MSHPIVLPIVQSEEGISLIRVRCFQVTLARDSQPQNKQHRKYVVGLAQEELVFSCELGETKTGTALALPPLHTPCQPGALAGSPLWPTLTLSVIHPFRT